MTLAQAVINLFGKQHLRYLFLSRSLTTWVTTGLRMQGYTIMNTNGLEATIGYKGNTFCLNPLTSLPIFTVHTDYEFEDIGPDDVVLDIGAQAGAFTIPAARRAKFVWALEPLFCDELRANLELNGIKNVEVLEMGIANRDGIMPIEFWGRQDYCQVRRFATVKELIGRVDFLKMDCEGHEWSIKLGELEDIKRIEAELHMVKGNRLEEWKSWLDKQGYDYRLEYGHNEAILHATLGTAQVR